MKTVTLKIDESVDEQFSLFLAHFSSSEIQILEQSEYMIDDAYLRSINGMDQSLHDAKREPLKQKGKRSRFHRQGTGYIGLSWMKISPLMLFWALSVHLQGTEKLHDKRVTKRLTKPS
jgi:hypothetical protein